MTELEDFLWAYQNVVHAVGINALLGLSVYVVMSVGQLSLGQAAFQGLGAYTGALLSVKLGVPFYLVLPASALLPAVVALLIGVPTLKLSGVYLAIATIALGEVLRVMLLNAEITGGPLGLSGIPEHSTTLLIYGVVAVAVVGFWMITRSRIGRAMEAMREDEVAASVMGVNLPAYKMGALIASSVLAGVAGALSAHSTTFIAANDYGFEHAVAILSFALLGGIGSPLGPVVGAAVLTVLPEVLRPLSDFRLVFNGLIIVLVVLFMPRGLLGWRMGRTG